jgi:hypothetical protein
MVTTFDGNAGFHERTHDGGWGPFIPFPQAPNANLNDPRIRFIDLSGDGLDDILLTTDYMQKSPNHLGIKIPNHLGGRQV